MYETNTPKMPTFLAHYCNKAKLHVPQLLFYYQTLTAAMQTITIKMMGKGNFIKYVLGPTLVRKQHQP